MSTIAYSFISKQVPKSSHVVIYGGGTIGKALYYQLKVINHCKIMFIADRNWKNLCIDDGNVRVAAPTEIASSGADYVIIATNILSNIIEMMQTLRETCAAFTLGKIVFLHDTGALVSAPDIVALATKEAQRARWPQSTSQHGEDMVIKYLFTKLGITTPSYIDVGANHPIFLSNTALLYTCGSRGLNIEANPALIDAFLEQRPEDETISVGIGVETGSLVFHVCDSESFISTFSQANLDYWSHQLPLAKWHAIEIPVVTLTSIINEHLGGKWPDLLDIDIEGMDYEVLQATDLTNGPIIIIAEMIAEMIDGRADAVMARKGYMRYCTIAGINGIYVRNDHVKKLLVD